METSAATAAANAMVQDPPNAFFGNLALAPFPQDNALEGQPEVEMELPEAFSIQEFLEKPEEFRPQKTFLTEYIEVKNPFFIMVAPKLQLIFSVPSPSLCDRTRRPLRRRSKPQVRPRFANCCDSELIPTWLRKKV